MKATGIIRRIDELGRIVIPKEIRRTFRIKEGTPLEIFCGDNGELILKKYSLLLDIKDFSNEICEVLHNTLNISIIVTDKENILSVCGYQKKLLLNKKISYKLDDEIDKRIILFKSKSEDNLINICDELEIEMCNQIIVPIISNGDVCGSIIAFTKNDEEIDESKVLSLKLMSNFLSNQIG